MIPPILHRIWVGERPLPPTFYQYGNQWEDLHPEWQSFLWDDDQVIELLIPLKNQELWNKAQYITDDWVRFRADILRLELLFRFGGVYVDTDVRPLKPFDLFLQDPCFMGLSPNVSSSRRVVTNAIIGATPAHPFIRFCIDRLPQAVKEHEGKPIAQMVGPWHLTRCLHRYESFGNTLKVYPSWVFYPQSIADRDAGKTPNLSGSWAYHHWNSTALKKGIGYE